MSMEYPVATRKSGAVLLEVVLALVLFVGAATIIGTGLNASADGVERLRLSVHGANLAASVICELQMGVRTLADTGPEPFDRPFNDWVYEIHSAPIQSALAEATGLIRVEAVVKHEESGYVHRLGQTLALSELRAEAELLTVP